MEKSRLIAVLITRLGAVSRYITGSRLVILQFNGNSKWKILKKSENLRYKKLNDSDAKKKLCPFLHHPLVSLTPQSGSHTIHKIFRIYFVLQIINIKPLFFML